MSGQRPRSGGWLAQRLRSFGYAFGGLATLLREQPHAQLHLLATLLVVSAGWWLQLSRGDWQVLLLTVALVWLAEALNTALEYLCDAVHPQQHPLIGKAKDVAAAGVLLCALFALLQAVLIFGPYVLG